MLDTLIKKYLFDYNFSINKLYLYTYSYNNINYYIILKHIFRDFYL